MNMQTNMKMQYNVREMIEMICVSTSRTLFQA